MKRTMMGKLWQRATPRALHACDGGALRFNKTVMAMVSAWQPKACIKKAITGAAMHKLGAFDLWVFKTGQTRFWADWANTANPQRSST